MNYTIILNLGGNLVTQLTQAEQQLVRINGLAQKINGGSGTRTASGIGGTVGGSRLDRLYNISQRLGSGQTQEQFNRRFNEAFKHIQRFQNDFIRNSFTISGFRRNFSNFVGSVDAFASAITNAVPVLGAASSALKAFALSSAVPVVVGGLAYSAGSKFLNSRNIREATSDRLQFEAAERGLGSEYAEALRGASTIASQYGISRAQALANINILSGLETESGSISYGQANDITRAAAIIGSFGSVPFERVAQNLQQILSVNEPNARDIRELIHQAPILSKYALQDLQSQGEIGGDPREYYKDRDNLLKGLYRLLEEFKVPLSALIRGRQELRRRDFYISAERQLEPLFSVIGETTNKLYDRLEISLEKFVRNFDSSTWESNFDSFVSAVGTLADTAITAASKLGGIASGAANYTGTIVATLAANKFLKFLPAPLRLAATAGVATTSYLIESDVNESNYKQIAKIASERTRFNNILNDAIISASQLTYTGEGNNRRSLFEIAGGDRDNVISEFANQIPQSTRDSLYMNLPRIDSTYTERLRYNGRSGATIEKTEDVADFNNSYVTTIFNTIADIFKNISNSIDKGGLRSGVGLSDTNDIETLTKGSRSLHIYFQAPLAEVNNNITTGANAQEIVDRFETQTVDIVSRVLQEAIYNATLIS